MTVAIALIIAILTTGTLALVVGTALNEFFNQKGTPPDEPEVLLHDDYDQNVNKDVYVENTGNQEIYIRIKLEERMVVGSFDPDDSGNWQTHKPVGNPLNHEDCLNADINIAGFPHLNFHDVFDWTWGQDGDEYFMPGQSKMPGESFARRDPVDPSEPGAKKTQSAGYIYTADGTYHTVVNYDWYSTWTQTDQGAYFGWIYFPDGYAYWSQPLPPGEATGFILNNVVVKDEYADEDYYYAINVIAEAVNKNGRGEWDDEYNDYDDDGQKVIDDLFDRGQDYISGIRINGAKTNYTEGQAFQFTSITVTYEGGSKVTVPSNNPGIQVSPSGPLSTSDTSVTVTYKGKTLTVNVNVSALATTVASTTAPPATEAPMTAVPTTTTTTAAPTTTAKSDQDILEDMLNDDVLATDELELGDEYLGGDGENDILPNRALIYGNGTSIKSMNEAFGDSMCSADTRYCWFKLSDLFKDTVDVSNGLPTGVTVEHSGSAIGSSTAPLAIAEKTEETPVGWCIRSKIYPTYDEIGDRLLQWLEKPVPVTVKYGTASVTVNLIHAYDGMV